MSIPELNTAAKIQNECENSNSTKQKKSDNAIDMDLVEKETVTVGPVNMAKSKEIVSDNMDNSKDLPTDVAVWAQYGPTHRPFQIPEYPLGPGFVFPQTQVQPKTAQGGYPTQTGGRGAQKKQAHAYPTGGSPAAPAGNPAGGGGYFQGFGGGGGKRGGGGGKQGGGGGQDGGGGQGGEEEGEGSGSDASSEEGWEYIPETKNRWVFKILSLVTLTYFVTTVAVLTMDETLGTLFSDIPGVIVAAVAMLILIIIQLVQSMAKVGILPPPAFVILFICVPCMGLMLSLPTIMIPTYVAILGVMAMTILSFLLMVLAFCTAYNFNSWSMYLLVPFLGAGSLGALLGLVSILLQVQFADLELGLIFFIIIINCFVYVYLFQTVLSGNFEEHGDEIYVYAATMLYTTIVLIIVILIKLSGKKRRRRRRRRAASFF